MKRVIGVAGLPGSGKSLVSNSARKKGVVIINMGDFIREEASKRNESSGKVAVDLRKEQGEYVLAKMCVDKIRKSGDVNFLIDGIRSTYEVDLFRRSFKNFKVLSVFSSPRTRFNRLKLRMRDDDSCDYEDFRNRDLRELGFGIGDVISLSNYIIVNEGHIKNYKFEINKYIQHEFKL